MDDRQLLALMRLALEAEELERGVHHAADPPHTRRLPRWLIGAAGLAAAMFGVLVWLAGPAQWRPRSPAQNAEGTSAGAILADVSLPEANPEVGAPDRSGSTGLPGLSPPTPAGEQCVVMAVFRGARGTCECVQVHDVALAHGQRLGDVDHEALCDLALRDPCTTSAERVLILAVSGSPDAVARASAQATMLGTVLAAAPPVRSEDLAMLAHAAMPAMPPGTTLVARMVALRP